MKRLHAKLAAGAALLILGGCATEPYGPTIPVMPGPGKPFAQFQQDDAQCQQFAGDRVAGRVDQVNNNALGAAVVGTALGAGLGAAVGNGRGAAIGAASGAVVGSSIGANEAAWGERGIQRQYNIAYAQCMTSKGNRVGPRHRRYPPPPPGYGAPPPGYGPPQGNYGPPSPPQGSPPPPPSGN